MPVYVIVWLCLSFLLFLFPALASRCLLCPSPPLYDRRLILSREVYDPCFFFFFLRSIAGNTLVLALSKRKHIELSQSYKTRLNLEEKSLEDYHDTKFHLLIDCFTLEIALRRMKPIVFLLLYFFFFFFFFLGGGGGVVVVF